MKKHDEGYALILVVVTLIVLAILSAALMSMGVQNLKNQKASMERMVDKYDAQGEMEKQVAEIEAKIETKLAENPGTTFEIDGAASIEDAAEKWIEDLELQLPNVQLSVTKEEGTLTKGTFSYEISLSAQSESENTHVSCVLELIGTVKEKEQQLEDGETTPESEPGTLNKTYEITFSGLNYTSYNMSEGGAGE